MNKTNRILITGGYGLLGTALRNLLEKEGYLHVFYQSSAQYDLIKSKDTFAFFQHAKPDYVFHLAAHVNGIGGNIKNQHKAYLNNVRINTNVIEACVLSGVKKILAMGTGAVYPHSLPGGMLNEAFIFEGEPHDSEYGYAIAKRAMLSQLKICEKQYGLKYVFPVSANLYGPNDHFDTENGHVVPSLVRKFYETKTFGGKVKVWGQGLAKRDFLYVDDAARALLSIMQKAEGPINLGSGDVRSIFYLVEILSKISGVSMDLVEWDGSKPEGASLRSYDLTKLMSTGFKCEHSFEGGIRKTYEWLANNFEKARK